MAVAGLDTQKLVKALEGRVVIDSGAAKGGAILRAALAAVEGKPVAGDGRGACQRRADVLVDLGRHRLDAGDLPTSSCQRPHLTITATQVTKSATIDR